MLCLSISKFSRKFKNYDFWRFLKKLSLLFSFLDVFMRKYIITFDKAKNRVGFTGFNYFNFFI